MKTIITLAIGFWIGRQMYINYNKKEAKRKETELKERLQKFLVGNGITRREAKKQSEQLIKSK